MSSAGTPPTREIPIGPATLDWRAILLAAGLFVIITLPTGIIASALAGDNENSNWVVVAALVVAIVAPAITGAVAARGHRRSPLTHGAIAAAIGWAVIAAVSLVSKLAKGDAVAGPLFTLLLLGCVDVSVAVVAAYFTFRREVREPPGPDL